MSLGETLHVGPINLPVRYLVFIAAVAFGILVMTLVLRKRPELRRATVNRVLNALTLFVIIWKLEPMAAALVMEAARGKINLQSVVLQIFVPGGDLASLIAAAVAVVYLAASILAADRRSWGNLAAASAAILPAALLYSVLLIALGSPAGGTVARAGSAGAAAPPVGTAVGDLAPRFAAKSLDGGVYRMAGSRGEMIVLNFWATWCPPCRAELPDLVRFARAHASSRTAVWAVNMTTSESSTSAVRSFSRLHGIDFPVLLDQTGAIARAYGVTAVPTTFVISSKGVIIAKQVGAMSPSWLRSQTSRDDR